MLVGADIDTTGKAEKSGLCITSVLGTIAAAQLCVAVQLLNKESQNALMEAPCAIARVSPGFAQTDVPELNRYADNEYALSHLHTAVLAQRKSNSLLH